MDRDIEAALSQWEKSSLDAVKVEPLRYVDVNKAVDNALDAIGPDPVTRYLYDTPDAHRSLFLEKRQKIALSLGILDAVHRHVVFTVNHGDAMITLEPAPRTQQKRVVRHVGLAIRRLFTRWLGLFNSKEQRKRLQEYHEQVTSTVEASLGDQTEDMMLLEGFATAPEKQGRGYGTALGKHVSAIADAQGRSIWLVSSNVANTGFYESLGFRTVGEFPLGENNPVWEKPPVIVSVMVRKPWASNNRDEKSG